MLKKVTFTGIDQSVKAVEIAALHKEFPFVEFGFLISASLTGKNKNPRYPSVAMLKGYRKMNVPMALHVCGALAMDLVKKDDWESVRALVGDSLDLFDRIQINAALARHMREKLSFPEGKQIILQLHDGNDAMWEKYGHVKNVVGFQDNSGGTGRFDGEWRVPMADFFGYGGGISPENVVEAVRQINEVAHGVDYWIDMESGVRTRDKFDLAKCRDVCVQLVNAGLI